MDKLRKRMKTIAFSMAMTASLSLPLGALGQSQGLFGETGDSEGCHGLLGRGNRGNTEGTFTHQTFGNNYDGTFTHQTFGINHEGNFTHQTFGNNTPTGSGMLILLSAGLGYAATKRKRTTKINKKKNQIK